MNPPVSLINPNYRSPACFLADCHLPLIPSPATADWTPCVVRFLRSQASQAQSLFIVGDLFDFWFEWRHSVPSGAFPVLAELRELHNKGIRVLYVGGNHDGHVGKFLTEQVGIEISRKPVDVLVGTQKVHVIHGDGLASNDLGYRILRGVVRWPPTEAVYRLVHPDFGISFANWLSHGSQKYFSGKQVKERQSYRDYAVKVLDQGANLVVMGHRHEAEWIPHTNGGFMAVGDWIRSKSYGWIEDGKAELRYFES